MDIKRSDLVRMVAEEVQKALQEFSHGENEAKKKKAGKRPETKDASDEPSKKDKGEEKPRPAKSAPPPGDAAADVEEPVDDPVARGDGEYDTSGDDELPGDDELNADNADADTDMDDALDDEGDAGTEDDVDGPVADQLRGRTVENITLEPESDLVPGSREIVFTFGDSPDILRICVDGVGNILFYLNGQSYDMP